MKFNKKIWTRKNWKWYWKCWITNLLSTQRQHSILKIIWWRCLQVKNYQLKRYFFCCFCLLMMNAFVFDIIVWCLLVFHSKIVFLKKFYNDLWFTQKVVSTFLRFLLGRWTTFLSVGCFVLESRLNKILEFLWWSAKTWNMLI